MNAKVIKLLENNTEANLTNYANLDLKSPDRISAIKVIAQEFDIINQRNKVKLDMSIAKRKMELDEERLQFDREKLEEEKRMSLQKAELEKKRLELDEYRFTIEKYKQDSDKTIRLEEINLRKIEFKETKKQNRWSVVSGLVGALVPVVAYGVLTVVGFKLVYVDDGRIPSEVKDLMKLVLKKL